MLQLKSFYSANELLELGLKSLPSTHRGILDKAKRDYPDPWHRVALDKRAVWQRSQAG